MKIYIEKKVSDYNGRCWLKCKDSKWRYGVLEDGRFRVVESSQILYPRSNRPVLVEDHESFSLIINKQIPPNGQVTQMAAAAKKAAKKAAPKKVAKKAAPKKAGVKKEGPGKIEQILELHKKGLSNAEIVEKGFNKTTVSIQVSKYKRKKLAEKEARAKAKG